MTAVEIGLNEIESNVWYYNKILVGAKEHMQPTLKSL